jgi:hypothetical protein
VLPANAKSVASFLQQSKPLGKDAWELPFWGNPLAAGIFPLCAVAEERFFPLGTAFVIGRQGIVASAMHNIDEALTYQRAGNTLAQMLQLPSHYTMKEVGLSLLHHLQDGQRMQVNFWPLESGNPAPPSDLFFGSAIFQTSFGYLALSLSPAVPRIGSRVICVGYEQMEFPGNGIPVTDIQSGKFDWETQTKIKLRAVEGTVKAIFVPRFSLGFVNASCILLDCNVGHGQSGGPVFNENGYVCGVISAGTERYFGIPGSLISLLHPVLMNEIDFGADIGGVRINARHPMLALIRNGSISTDGTEQLSTAERDGSGWRVDPLIRREDASFVYPSVQAYLAGRPAQGNPIPK